MVFVLIKEPHDSIQIGWSSGCLLLYPDIAQSLLIVRGRSFLKDYERGLCRKVLSSVATLMIPDLMGGIQKKATVPPSSGMWGN
eukprot:7733942-Pyramimonas_sp.AAC.1